jgi:hypothetical protein
MLKSIEPRVIRALEYTPNSYIPRVAFQLMVLCCEAIYVYKVLCQRRISSRGVIASLPSQSCGKSRDMEPWAYVLDYIRACRSPVYCLIHVDAGLGQLEPVGPMMYNERCRLRRQRGFSTRTLASGKERSCHDLEPCSLFSFSFYLCFCTAKGVFPKHPYQGGVHVWEARC